MGGLVTDREVKLCVVSDLHSWNILLLLSAIFLGSRVLPGDMTKFRIAL